LNVAAETIERNYDAPVLKIGPQPGPQTDFLATNADIAIYGGAAGGGKTYALLLEPLRHYDNPLFGAVIFRRQTTQVRNQGGLWDESEKLYPLFGAHPREYKLEWEFPKRPTVKFAHLEHDHSVLEWQGGQIPFIGFDELTHFTEKQFFYMLSRNRSDSGVKSYVRATCNPDCDSWVRKFIDWWIGPDGYADKSRSGVLRYFIRLSDDSLAWADTAEDLTDKYGSQQLPKSVTFIPSSIADNPILREKDPGYEASLHALNRVDRLRLKDGNWNVRANAGSLFREEWFPVIKHIPGGFISVVRFWDRAATKPNPDNPEPDWTRGLKLYRYPNETYVVADLKSDRNTPGKIETLIKNVASHDGVSVRIVSQCDPGSAGKSEAEHFVKMLRGYDVRTRAISKDKVTRAKPVSAQAEGGAIYVLEADWNAEFFGELQNFPDGLHDDIVDVLSGAYNEISGAYSLLDAL